MERDFDLVDEAGTVERDISFLFGGIGDARHLYNTWIELMPALLTPPATGGLPHFHFVLNDEDPHVFARNLILWYLLEELTRAGGRTLSIISTIYYVFCAPIMPPQTHDHLQNTIQHCIEMLEDKASLPRWLVVLQGSRPPIIAALRTWQSDVPDLYDVSTFHKSMTAQMAEHVLLSDDTGLTAGYSESLQIEHRCYEKTLLLLPPASLMKEDPLLMQLYQRCSKDPTKVKKLRSHVADKWRVNPTLFNLKDERLQDNIGELYPDPWRLLHDMYEASSVPPPEGSKTLLGHVTTFFQMLSAALQHLGGVMTVYISVGDIAHQMEKFRFLNDDVKSAESTPITFDCIHLSNIPDYLGMDLFSFQYAIPLLKLHEAAFVTYNCLTCPPRWKTLADYNAESVLLHNPNALARGLNVKFTGFWEDNAEMLFNGPFASYAGMKYFTWRQDSDTPRRLEDLLPRADFNHWIYGMFFQLALPAVRHLDKHKWGVAAIVWKPLNLTALLRLMIHLHTLGYPSHWLGQLLSSILTDNVVTSARPSTGCPISPDEASKRWPLQKIHTSAFIAEMSTLTAQFSRALPFAVILEAGAVPELEAIRECTIQWPTDSDPPAALQDGHRADFVLVFCHMDMYVSAQHEYEDMRDVKKLRETLNHPKLSEEVKDAVHIVTTWRWDLQKKKASFWLREDVLNKMMKNRGMYGWRVENWRTDSWLPLNLFHPFMTEAK